MKELINRATPPVTLTLLLAIIVSVMPAAASAATRDTSDDLIPPLTESCVWVESQDCTSCSFQPDCWVWYGWERRLGVRCTLTLTEYCDGLPTGNTQQSSHLRCGC